MLINVFFSKKKESLFFFSFPEICFLFPPLDTELSRTISTPKLSFAHIAMENREKKLQFGEGNCATNINTQSPTHHPSPLSGKAPTLLWHQRHFHEFRIPSMQSKTGKPSTFSLGSFFSISTGKLPSKLMQRIASILPKPNKY